ncbi:tyrosine-type recombinase/integrase [Pontibaca methylaminivorans]|uniref:tyrosine-type recombinase/integrase n=1 Tax=Pontibaca methylaminivorans TaxID=515897 RepID=UPI002FD8DD19
MALSDTKIRALKSREKPYRVADAQSLYLQVTPSGGKHWRMNYTFEGRQKTLAFGSYPAVNLLAARMARDKAKQLLAEGIDPSGKKEAPAAPVAGETFEQVATRWFKLNKHRWVSAYAVRLRARLDQDILPHLGDKPIASIKPRDVLDTIRKIEARGAIEMARRIHQMVSQIFRFAVAENLIPFDPARDIGDALAPKPAPKRRSAMPAEEILEFLASVRAYQGDPGVIFGLQLVAHTVVRTNELRMAEWGELEDLDGDEPIWRIPADKMKMRRDHIVPLTPQAVKIIKSIKPITGHQRWVFLSSVSGAAKPMSNNAMLFAMYRLGHHSRATVHGFRSSFSTWANERQFNRDWIEVSLAHVDNSIRGVYNSALYLPQRREMMGAWSDFIDPRDEIDDLFG